MLVCCWQHWFLSGYFLFVFSFRSSISLLAFPDFPISTALLVCSNIQYSAEEEVFAVSFNLFRRTEFYTPETIGFCPTQFKHSSSMSGNMTYSSDEVNFLVYRYLQESGKCRCFISLYQSKQRPNCLICSRFLTWNTGKLSGQLIFL